MSNLDVVGEYMNSYGLKLKSSKCHLHPTVVKA